MAWDVDRAHRPTRLITRAGTGSICSQLRRPRVRRLLVFGASAAFAIQALSLIHLYGIWGLPVLDEWNFSGIVTSYVSGGEFWTEPGFSQYHGSRTVLPHLIMLADAHLFSWSLVFQMYLGWAFLAGSLALTYLLIRQHGDGRLEYLLIPTAAILFSPHQYPMLLWAHSSVTWTVTLLGFICCMYCLSRVPASKLWLAPAVAAGTAITFSITTGLAVWFIGLAGLILLVRRTGAAPLLIWTVSALVVLAVFAYDYFDDQPSGEIGRGVSSLLSDRHGPEYVLSMISNGMHLHYGALHVAYGAVMVSVLALAVAYMYKRGVMRGMIPFIQLFLFGLSAAAITYIGRPGTDPLSPYYVIRGSPAEIAFLVVLAAACAALAGTRRSRVAVAASAALMIVLSAGIGAAYYTGYASVQASHEFHAGNIPCLADMSNIQSHTIMCPVILHMPDNTALPMTEQIPAMAEAGLGLYGIHELQPRSDALLRHEDWAGLRAGTGLKGGIDRPLWNDHNPEGLVFDMDAPQYVSLSGWSLLSDGQEPDAVYVFVGDRIIKRATYGVSRSDVPDAAHAGDRTGWYAFVDVSTLRGGGADGKICHDVQVRVLDGGTYGLMHTEPVCIRHNAFDTWGGIDDPAGPYPDWRTGIDPDEHPTVTLSGWTVIERNYRQPDGIVLLIDDRTYDETTYGLERPDVGKLAGVIEYDPGWEITADIADLETGCHDVKIRIMRGDAYTDTETRPLCIS